MILAFGRPLGDEKPGPLSLEDRTRTVHVLGAPGEGKTSLLRFMIAQEEGCGVIDFEETLGFGADILFSPIHREGIQPFNILKSSHPYATVEGILAALKRAWWDAWGSRTEDLLRHSLALAIEFGLKLPDVVRVLSDQTYRERLAHSSENERTQSFFLGHLAGVSARDWRTWVEAPRNKLAQFAYSPYIRPFFESDDCLDLKAIMDEGRSVHFNLPERLMKDSASLMAMLVVSQVYTAALERPEGSTPWALYCDEFQKAASQSFVDLSVRGRKRGVSCVVSHQSLFQPPFDKDHGLIESVLATAAVKVVFGCGRRDAERMAKEMLPPSGTSIKRVKKKHWLFGGQDVQSFYTPQEETEQMATAIERQEPGQCFIKIRGTSTTVFEAVTYEAPVPEPPKGQDLPVDTPLAPKRVPEAKRRPIAQERPKRRKL